MVAPTAEAGELFWDVAFLLMVPSNLFSFQMPAAAGSERYKEIVVTDGF